MHTFYELKNFISSLFEDQLMLVEKLIPKESKPGAINDIILREREQLICPTCGSSHIVKNGLKNRKQKLYCKDCKHSSSANSCSISYKTKKSFDQWIHFIHCELLGLSLETEAQECIISRTTAFSWRHKLYSALEESRKSIVLSGEIQIDGKFISINLKGTKPKDMPRLSKKRTSTTYRGISHHKLCILTALDEHDNLIMLVAGTGRENTQMMKLIEKHLLKGTKLICDGSHSFNTFAHEHNMHIEIIKSGTYKNNNGYSLSEINQIHQEIDLELRKRKGVSLKHLQGYLDMLWLKKLLHFTAEYYEKDSKAFNTTIPVIKRMFIKDIFAKSFPIDLVSTYSDFKMGTKES